MLPKEIIEKIYYYYISIYKNNMKMVHEEILNIDKIIYNKKLKKVLNQIKTEELYLNLTDDIFDFHLDFIFALRIPKLI